MSCMHILWWLIYVMYRYEKWGICFIYATWFALGGLAAIDETYDNCAAIRKAVHFLLKSQVDDCGWGESYLSCPKEVIFLYILYINIFISLYMFKSYIYISFIHICYSWSKKKSTYVTYATCNHHCTFDADNK